MEIRVCNERSGHSLIQGGHNKRNEPDRALHSPRGLVPVGEGGGG